MSFTYAGQWGPDSITGAGGAPLPNDTVTVYESDGVTLATLYTDRTMGSTTPNPTAADLYGNLSVFAVPGQYVLSGNGGTLNITVPVDPADVGTGGGAVSSVFGRTGVVAAQSGDYTVSEVTGAAPLASPALTGTPTAPTASALDNSTKLATTAYADTAVGVETTRAETAEALLLPLAGGTMSGAIAMGSHKVTGLTNGSVSSDAAAFGQIPTALPPNGSASGDLSGSYPGPTVAKVQGVALTLAEATLVSQLNGATTRSATGSLAAGEQTVFTGSTGSQTLTLPGSTAQVSTPNVVVNIASVSVTLAPGSGTTLNNMGTAGNIVIAAGTGYSVILIGTVWYVFDSTGLGGAPSGSASGDLSGSYPSPTVAKINGTALSGLATGLLKNTTTTGVPSIATAGTDYMAATPTAGGDLSGTLPSPTVAKLNGVAAASYALLASPTFTGTPAAPTPSALDNSTKLATTAYADALRTAVQTLTNKTLTSPAVTGMSGTETNVTPINNAVSVTSNAGTVPVTSKLSTFTNSSAAAMTITIATASAVDGQPLILRIYDFSAVAETITFVNCESSNVSLPAQSNGSTTLPLTVQFMYNSATSKWRCMGWA